ncbi:MAG: tetratricopeptide repeat protein [Verrucomicrobiaceae bacterium]
MNRTLVIRLCIILLGFIFIAWLWNAMKDASDGVKLVVVVVLGLVGGILVVKFVIPMLGDALGESIYSSGEKTEQDEMTKAAACISQGNYEGAIEHYEKMLEDKPDDPFPVAEIAKVHAERLHDAQAAIRVLEEHLQSKDWPVDDAAFIMFRIAEIQLQYLHDFDTAQDILEQVVANFPNTRHSANANHKIHELEQAQYKLIMEQRSKTGGGTGGTPAA